MTEEMDFYARFEYIYEMYECIRMKRYTIDEYIEDLMANNESKYICDNMKELVKEENIQILIEQGLLEKLRQLNPAKFKEIHSLIVCKMTGIKLQLIPYHKRILQPLLRRRVLSGFMNLYIEISKYLPFDNSITDKDAYLIYKELRDDGIIWLDAKKKI